MSLGSPRNRQTAWAIVLATDGRFPFPTQSDRDPQPPLRPTPVGRSLWRKRVREGKRAGVKAKTLYPARPERWSGTDWPPDLAFELVKAGLLRGKEHRLSPAENAVPHNRRGPGEPRDGEGSAHRREMAVGRVRLLLPTHATLLRGPEFVKSVPTEWRKRLQLPEDFFVTPATMSKFTSEVKLRTRDPIGSFGKPRKNPLEKSLLRTWQKARGRV